MSNRIRTNYIIVMKDFNVEDIDVTNNIILWHCLLNQCNSQLDIVIEGDNCV